MIKKYFYLLLFFSTAFIIFMSLGIHISNKNLIKFNKIIFKGNSFIQSNELFNIINYKIDSLDYYKKYEIDMFLSKIYELKNYDIIDDVSISYSLPNQIIVNIIEKKPTYIIKNNINDFALDDNGLIISTDFLNDNIQNVELEFLVYEIYKELDGIYDIKKLFRNINYNKINNEYLLNGINILNQIYNYPIKQNVKSMSITEHEINLDLNTTKIIFNHNDLENQLLKFNNIINSKSFIDTLKIKNITDLEEINLSFHNQIILKK